MSVTINYDYIFNFLATIDLQKSEHKNLLCILRTSKLLG